MQSQQVSDFSAARPRVEGKFLAVGAQRYLVKGVAYGTFAPDTDGVQFPVAATVAADFRQMAAAGINTVRTYTVPPEWLLDQAATQGLRVMVGMPWAQHIAFLDDRALARQIRQQAVDTVRLLADHPAVLLCALGNEIPPSVVRWHGQRKVERFLRDLAHDVKDAAPDTLLTYVNFPPTEFLDTDAFDVCAFNVYLHRQANLRAYLARLQHLAGNRPLLMAEAGADSLREGVNGQAAITSMHIRTAFEEGACGAVAFSWTDEWWRGGNTVTDWAFGLVDAERRPKPALEAVSEAFADAPFPAAEQARWPRVSVVVCGYNAADTLDDCLTSLEKLTYPNVELLFVNDGSRDNSSEIAARYPKVHTIEIANGGLSAARNVGLSAATGEIVAYTDADVRVDPDWLTYLVQPFLTSEVVGAGGPNVIPADDPWVAQCVARAPGGPTHVLLDDRIAEHVPGCNMAFRREALLAVGGFNPVYLRAGDDVDVCWRLQAKGQRIGFAPAALVWHHHRASLKAYWRQQVGYGEGETWLDAHHPEKFIGGQMLWRGRIYSPLPFVRSLAGVRMNTGVWGTAAFPSVYSTEANPAQFLPHSLGWMAVCTALLLSAAALSATPYRGIVLLLLMAGVAGWATTIVRCLRFSWASNLDVLGVRGRTARLRYRAVIAWLHLVQPLARAYGRLRGLLTPPSYTPAPEHVSRSPWKVPMPSIGATLRSALLLVGGSTERSFWSERWTSNATVLADLVGALRAARPAPHLDVDDGWRADRDISLGVGRWGWLHARALIEEHAQGRCLLRVGLRLRPSLMGFLQALALAGALVAVTGAGIAFLRGPVVSLIFVSLAALILTRAAWQTTRTVSVMERALRRVAMSAGMVPLPVEGVRRVGRFQLMPSSPAQLAQTAIVTLLISSGVVSAIYLERSVAAREAFAAAEAAAAASAAAAQRPPTHGGVSIGSNGDLFVADPFKGVIRRLRVSDPARTSSGTAPIRLVAGSPLPFEAAADIAMAPNGDLFVADPKNHRVCRIERPSGRVITVAGTGGEGFDSEARQAAQSPLRRPEAIAVDQNGDLFIADTLNNRIRVVSLQTGLIRTVAGTGEPNGPTLDEVTPATEAYLDAPRGVAVAPSGDLYISDTGHNRVRRVDALTGRIATVAAIEAPTGLALVPAGSSGVSVYVVDSKQGVVRVIAPDGKVSTLAAPRPLSFPTRLAYDPAGWLLVKDSSPMAVTAIAVPNPARVKIASAPRRPAARKRA